MTYTDIHKTFARLSFINHQWLNFLWYKPVWIIAKPYSFELHMQIIMNVHLYTSCMTGINQHTDFLLSYTTQLHCRQALAMIALRSVLSTEVTEYKLSDKIKLFVASEVFLYPYRFVSWSHKLYEIKRRTHSPCLWQTAGWLWPLLLTWFNFNPRMDK